MATINVTQEDIDNCDPQRSGKNCIALALKRLKRRDDINAYGYLGHVRIGKRRYEIDLYGCNRLIIHSAGIPISPFSFELSDAWTNKLV